MNNAINLALDWLENQQPQSMKELSRIVWARGIWQQSSKHTAPLILLKGENYWNGKVREASRAASALASAGLVFPDVSKWLFAHQEQIIQNKNIYDLTYFLLGLADMNVYDPKCATFLVNNYSDKWAYPGTTALIIMALIKQKSVVHKAFIQKKANWLLAHQQETGGFGPISTSNIVIQALLLAGFRREIQKSISWIMNQQNSKGYWGKEKNLIIATALSLITLAYYDNSIINTDK